MDKNSLQIMILKRMIKLNDTKKFGKHLRLSAMDQLVFPRCFYHTQVFRIICNSRIVNSLNRPL
jgi:hypothetical protein